MQSLKRESVLWQFEAALQRLMSYLIQELTNWWPLLSFRLDCDLSEGDNQTVDVCVCREKCRGFQPSLRKNPVTPMQSFLIRLYCTCFLYITVLSVWTWRCMVGEGDSVLHVKKNWTKDSLNLFVITPHAETELTFCFTHSNSSSSASIEDFRKLNLTLQSDVAET